MAPSMSPPKPACGGLLRRSAALLLFLVLGSCRFEPDPRDDQGRRIFRVGYMPNLTHGPALYGLETGLFAEAMGPDVVVKGLAFNAGPSVIEALFAGELDVAYVGPNPAINAYVRSRGRAVRVVAGCTSGGASLVVQPPVNGPADLAGKRVASPQLANTQDIALRIWLRNHGLEAKEKGGTVQITPIAPSDIFTLFTRGELAGAWVPEPWASRLVLEAKGKVLVDERELWPGGDFPTTELIASTVALGRRPDLVRRFVAAHQQAIAAFERDPAAARRIAAERIAKETKARLPQPVIDRAFGELRFTIDPLEPQLRVLADHARALGYLEGDGLEGLVDRSYGPAQP